ncbi:MULTISPECIES: hypothetical protein [unclassified Sphingomonas]|uniref:hypothetical protein n=1 Tax=unclassified Sphingomonas TaxID=196159 RepID=UPI00092A39AB|nr:MULTISPECIES: hypothetical protein [unclassified Sphingomonas]OJU19207.1 MAG: hypothetical protein BGN95_20745 [Sphingomonas sp. 66-10]
MKPHFPLLVLALTLCGCVEHDFPSLLPRAGEQLDFREPPAPPPPVAAADPELDSRIAAARTRLSEAAATFATAATRAEQLAAAASGAAAGSDKWLDAQTALADLDAARARQVDVLAELEQLASDRAQALVAPYPALDEAVQAAQQAVDTSTARIAAIQRRLAPAD